MGEEEKKALEEKVEKMEERKKEAEGKGQKNKQQLMKEKEKWDEQYMGDEEVGCIFS